MRRPWENSNRAKSPGDKAKLAKTTYRGGMRQCPVSVVDRREIAGRRAIGAYARDQCVYRVDLPLAT
jgi:hypothetical protein